MKPQSVFFAGRSTACIALALPLLFAARLSAAGGPEALTTNTGFEDHLTGWKTAVSNDSKDKNCSAAISSDHPHQGFYCMRLETGDYGRVSVSANLQPVQPKDRYRVTAWMRAETGVPVREGEPGFLIRVTLFQNGKDAPSGHILIDAESRVYRGNSPRGAGRNDLPSAWKKIEAVIEIPEDATHASLNAFNWNAKGAVFVDDIMAVKVPPQTPLTGPANPRP